VSEVNRAILASMEKLIDDESSLTVLFDHRHEAILVNKKYLELNDMTHNEEFFSSCALCSWFAETSEGSKPITLKGWSRREVLETIFFRKCIQWGD
jgi:hypothetical protein